MRIIGGKYKGRKIIIPGGIRPTQDKVRKALFDILGDVEGLSFLELFAGSAAVGLEALSRGVSDLTLVEYDSDCRRAIYKNIASLAAKACSLLPLDTQKAIKILWHDKRRFDVIFLDPPYYNDLSKKTLQILEAYDILAPNGFVIVQHFKRDDLPKETKNLVVIKEARYGDTVLAFYRKQKLAEFILRQDGG